MSQDKYLFSEFPPVSEKEWKQQIQMELKGADYTKTLVWESLENIHVKPIYHPDSYAYLDIPIPEKDFSIAQEIFVDDPAIANKIALEALEKGADSLVFIAQHSFDIDVLFQNFDSIKKAFHLYFKTSFLSQSFLESLLEYFTDNRLHLLLDPIGTLAGTGNWNRTKDADFKTLSSLLRKYPNKSIISIDAARYQNAGANSVQQITYALAHANEYLNSLHTDTVPEFHFEFAIGSNYFFEIAKLRAFRYLWAKMQATKPEEPAKIIARPSLRNKTIYDYNVNLLRTTTEYMSAILGGADTIISQSYDSIFKKSNAFGSRIARNQLLLLKEENSFINAQEFPKGSYYIESLTIELAKKALSILKEIEKSGGFLKHLEKGSIQQKIQAAAQKEQDLFDSGKITLLGTNKYPNNKEKMQDELELFPFTKRQSSQTIIPPIVPKRLAEKMEKERLDTE